jgi:hypothetical protein
LGAPACQRNRRLKVKSIELNKWNRESQINGLYLEILSLTAKQNSDPVARKNIDNIKAPNSFKTQTIECILSLANSLGHRDILGQGLLSDLKKELS